MGGVEMIYIRSEIGGARSYVGEVIGIPNLSSFYDTCNISEMDNFFLDFISYSICNVRIRMICHLLF